MTYADNFSLRNYSAVKMADVASAVDGLLIDCQLGTDTSGISTSSGANTDTGLSITVSLNSGERAIVFWRMSFSNSSAGVTAFCRITDGTNSSGQFKLVNYVTGTDGLSHAINGMHVLPTFTGSRTIKLQYLTSSGTIYSNDRVLMVLVVQNT
jgi:hypothetical protein